MKSKIDKFSRVIIPKCVRETLGIKPNDEIRIELKDNQIIITKPKTN